MAGRMIVAALALCLSATAFAANDEFAKVELKGTLHFDGDTGRASIHADGFTYQINLGKDRELRRAAEDFDRRQVVVSGNLFISEGQNGCPLISVDANRIGECRGENVRYDDRHEVIRERPVQERVIIKEKAPLFKAGPLEIK